MRGVSLFIQPEDLAFEPLHVRTLEVVLLVLLLEQRHVLLDLAPLLRVELLAHARQRLHSQRPPTYRHLSRLCNPSLELLVLYPLFQHRDLVSVELLDAVDDEFFLEEFLLLGLPKGAFFLEELILLEV